LIALVVRVTAWVMVLSNWEVAVTAVAIVLFALAGICTMTVNC
jgi:hypothetical protein